MRYVASNVRAAGARRRAYVAATTAAPAARPPPAGGRGLQVLEDVSDDGCPGAASTSARIAPRPRGAAALVRRDHADEVAVADDRHAGIARALRVVNRPSVAP